MVPGGLAGVGQRGGDAGAGRVGGGYAPLIGRARAAGCLVSVADGQIGAIADAHGFMVATRDTTPFHAIGVPVINPWES